MSQSRILTTTGRCLLGAFVLCVVTNCKGNTGTTTPSTSFNAGAASSKAFAAPPEASPDTFALEVLEEVHESIGEAWASFVENCRLRLPETHALNDQRLHASVLIRVGADGRLKDVRVWKGSGLGDFDRSALEIVQDLQTLRSVKPTYLSDDGTIHLQWQFARDKRQAGTQGAQLVIEEWPLQKAVSTFLAQGHIKKAASRLVRVAKNGKFGEKKLLKVAREIIGAIALNGLHGASNNQLMALDLVTQNGLKDSAAFVEEALPVVSKLAEHSLNDEVKIKALWALGSLGAVKKTGYLQKEFLGRSLVEPKSAVGLRTVLLSGL